MSNDYGVTGTDPFAIAAGNVIFKGATRSSSLGSNTATDGLGENIPATDTSFGEKETITANYGVNVNTAITLAAFEAGGGVAIAFERLTVTLAKGTNAKLVANGHQHIGGTGSLHTARARDITVPAFPGFGTSLFGLTVGPAAASIQSATYTVELGHIDEDDGMGNWLCGASKGEKHTVSFEAIENTAWVVPSGWKRVEDSPTPSQSAGGFESTRFSIFKTVAGPA